MHPDDRQKLRALLEWIRSELSSGRADRVVEAIKPFSNLEPLSDCIAHYENNKDWMRYDHYRSRGMNLERGGSLAIDAPAVADGYDKDDKGIVPDLA